MGNIIPPALWASPAPVILEPRLRAKQGSAKSAEIPSVCAVSVHPGTGGRDTTVWGKSKGSEEKRVKLSPKSTQFEGQGEPSHSLKQQQSESTSPRASCAQLHCSTVLAFSLLTGLCFSPCTLLGLSCLWLRHTSGSSRRPLCSTFKHAPSLTVPSSENVAGWAIHPIPVWECNRKSPGTPSLGAKN